MSLSLFFNKELTANNYLDSEALSSEIANSGITATLVGVVPRDLDFIVLFEEDELTDEDSSLLMSVIQNHQAHPPVTIVTPRQIRLALILSGIPLSVIDSAIDSLDEPQRSIARVSWEYSTEIDKNHPLIESMLPLVGLTPSQVDALFALAVTL